MHLTKTLFPDSLAKSATLDLSREVFLGVFGRSTRFSFSIPRLYALYHLNSTTSDHFLARVGVVRYLAEIALRHTSEYSKLIQIVY